MPCSIGAAMASKDRPVINYESDGSAMYTIQALWTQARENLNITTLIASNRKYNILQMEADRAKVSFGPRAKSLTDITDPDLNWVKLSEGLGVPAVSVETTESLAFEIKRSLDEKGPHLVEMVFT
jgi:acetolactate synthase-1/2/3 large subunit